MDLQVFATVVGSVGFPIIAIYFVWQKMDKNSQDYIKLLKEQMQDNKDANNRLLETNAKFAEQITISNTQINQKIDKIDSKVDSIISIINK